MKNAKNANFRTAWYTLSRENKYNVKVRNKIAYELNISTQTFYNYLYGITEIPILARPIIAKILKIEVEELFEMDEV